MSYRAGIGPGLESLGLVPGEPHIYCDSCGEKKMAMNPKTGRPWAWLLNHRAPNGWKLIRSTLYTREDYCPRPWCQAKVPQ